METLGELKKSYAGVGKIIRRYWSAYGGARSLLYSPYFHISILLTLIFFRFWLRDSWWETAISILPNVLGFTLAGFTIWLGFGDEQFRQRLSEPSKSDPESSAFLGVSATFAHFVVVQICALIAAVGAKAMNFVLPPSCWIKPLVAIAAPVGHFIGFLLFIYALLAALAATLGVFRAASWYQKHQNGTAKRQNNGGCNDQANTPPT